MKCPECKRSFRVLDDEQVGAECPYCGFTGHEDDDIRESEHDAAGAYGEFDAAMAEEEMSEDAE